MLFRSVWMQKENDSVYWRVATDAMGNRLSATISVTVASRTAMDARDAKEDGYFAIHEKTADAQ